MSWFPASMMLPPSILSGRGSVSRLLAACREFGPRGILVHGTALTRNDLLDRFLPETGSDRPVFTWRHPGGEPTLEQLEALLAEARALGPDWVAAVGGGSVLDIAKACAGLLRAPAPVEAYHDGAPIPPSCIPFIALPTTAGTGSEVTSVAVLTNTRTGVKKSIRHPSFLARLVILDPGLLTSCPPPVVAASGMDALTQAIESYVSRHATGITDAFALQAVRMIRENLPRVHDGDAGQPCDDLLAGSVLAGLALSHARLGLVHGLAHPLGARYHLPHGLVCAICLPPVLAFNREAMGAKYDRLCAAMGGDALTRAQDMMNRLRIESPFAGKSLHEEDAIVQETLASGSTAANPREVTEADVRKILKELFAS